MRLQERYSKIAQKSIKHLDLEIAKRILELFNELVQHPFPHYSRRCKDPKYRDCLFEINYFEYRILYEIIFEEETILVHKIEKKN